MKKLATINLFIVSLVIIFILIMMYIVEVYDVSNVMIKINEITVKETNVSEVDLYNFGINRNSISNVAKIKAVYIRCQIVNSGFTEVTLQPEFDEQVSLDFLLSRRLELVDGYKPIVPARKTKNMAYKFLIDSSMYSDEEIMELLKNVKFKIERDGSVVLSDK